MRSAFVRMRSAFVRMRSAFVRMRYSSRVSPLGLFPPPPAAATLYTHKHIHKHGMPTKTIGVREEVYDRLRARKRDDESFTDLIDRLIDESGGDWRDGFGSLSTEETESLREAAEASRERFNESAGDRQTAAIDRLADASGDGQPDDGADGLDDANDDDRGSA